MCVYDKFIFLIKIASEICYYINYTTIKLSEKSVNLLSVP